MSATSASRRSNAERGARGAWRVGACLCPLLVLMFGCATLNPPAVNPERKKRDEDIARRLAEQRDNAEFQSALARANEQDVQGCREQLDRLLARNPEHREARLLLADVLLTCNRPDEARAQVEKVLQAHPHDADGEYALGLILDATGQNGAALAHYEQAAKLAPENEVYSVGYRTARNAADSPPGNARPISATAPAANGSTAAVNPRAGYATSSDFAENDPAAALFRKGCAALTDGSPSTAADYFRQAAALQPHSPQILIASATTALAANQPQLAVDLLSPAAGRFKASAAIHRILGTAYYRLGDYQSAELALRQALSLDKSNPLSYFLVGCTLAKLGQAEAADACLRQAQAIDPRYTFRR